MSSTLKTNISSKSKNKMSISYQNFSPDTKAFVPRGNHISFQSAAQQHHLGYNTPQANSYVPHNQGHRMEGFGDYSMHA